MGVHVRRRQEILARRWTRHATDLTNTWRVPLASLGCTPRTQVSDCCGVEVSWATLTSMISDDVNGAPVPSTRSSAPLHRVVAATPANEWIWLTSARITCACLVVNFFRAAGVGQTLGQLLLRRSIFTNEWCSSPTKKAYCRTRTHERHTENSMNICVRKEGLQGTDAASRARNCQ